MPTDTDLDDLIAAVTAHDTDPVPDEEARARVYRTRRVTLAHQSRLGRVQIASLARAVRFGRLS